MKTNVLVTVGALLVGGAGGYLVGAGGKEDPKSADEKNRSSISNRAPGRPSSGGGGGSQASHRQGKSAGSLREILSEPGQTNRMMALLHYYNDLDPSQFEGEMQKLQNLPMSQRMLAMNLLFSRWAETDPHAALEQSKTMGFPEMFMARAGVVSGWAASNPEGLAKQYTENPGDFRMGGLGGRGGIETVAKIAGEGAKQNPEAALSGVPTRIQRWAGDALAPVFNVIAHQHPHARPAEASSSDSTGTSGHSSPPMRRRSG